jgi:hypothetical protein
MMRTFVAACLACWAIAAHASDWRLIASNESFDLFADAATFTAAPIVKVWVRFEGKPPYKEMDGYVQVKGVERWTIDCTGRKIATSDYTGYAENGEAVVTRPGSATQFREIPPDSVWDIAAGRLCEEGAME